MLPKIGILAGGGILPELIVRSCQSTGRAFYVIAFKGQASKNAFKDVPHTWVRLGAAGLTIRILRKAGVKELVMAGTIKRPSLAMLRPDIWTALFFIKTKAFNRGDDGLLSALIDKLENTEGFSIVGADNVLPSLIAKAGIYGNILPSPQDEENIKVGIIGAQDLGRRDLGQSVITRSGQVLLYEDNKGTDALLRRAGSLRQKRSDGVLVKVKKPGQERRADLPTIGLETVHATGRAGLNGIVIEAGETLVLNLKGIVKAANEQELFVLGANVPPSKPLIFLIAGEASGDLLGARLIRSLKIETENNISFAGIGGPHMEKEGLISLYPMSDLSVMGILEVLPRLSLIIKRLKETTDEIISLKPTAVVTIDSPDFNFRLAKRLKGKGQKLIHYVAPSVWAWRPKRARLIADLFDHLLTLLPFEPPLFEVKGLPTTFVGHSVLEGGADCGNGVSFRQRYGIAMKDKVIVVLPGSRISEISQLGNIFYETLSILKKKFPKLYIVLPSVPHLIQSVRILNKNWNQISIIIEKESEKFDAFAAADVALAASGTVALELALSKTPAVIAYKTSPFTWLLTSWFVNVRFVNLVNLILDREAVPELLQSNCYPNILAAKIEGLLSDKNLRLKQSNAYIEVLKQLSPKGFLPSKRAAKVILSLIKKEEK